MKTKITTGVYKMPAAAIDGDNGLPPVYDNGQSNIGVVSDGLTGRDAENLGKGFVQTVLPYTMQDMFRRERKPREFISVTLENDYLKAVVLPEIGGRVWSLYDKKQNKELLFKNNVFQPVAFGLRGAWVSGGVEWNVGVRGHSVHTCSTLFCSVNRYRNGRETVKLWEYERIRGVAYSVELCLPDDGGSLFARVTVENTSKSEKYMYWWTNIAVAETPGLRVLAPCGQIYVTAYRGERRYLTLIDVSKDLGENLDAAYPEKNKVSRDYFYKIPENSEKWIVSADKDGRGLAHTSTGLLKGRKMFVWGTGGSSRKWCEFLSDAGSGCYYAEIQGGLTNHQYEHVIMPADTTWQWTEAFTPFSANPGLIHSPDIFAAQAEAAKSVKMHGVEIERLNPYEGISPGSLESSRTVTSGSGWGYIENLIREKAGERAVSKVCGFTRTSVTDKEKDWLYLIENGRFPSESVTRPPKSFAAGEYIISLLKKAEAEGKAGAYTYLQSGTAFLIEGKDAEAVQAWERSMELQPNPWAARNIALLKRRSGDYGAAVCYMKLAISLNSSYGPLVIDCARLYYEAGEHKEWLNVYCKLSAGLKNLGRVKMFTAAAYLGLDMIEEAEKIINGDLVVEDMQEDLQKGELTIEKLWNELHLKKNGSRPVPPLPKELNFRASILV